ncbi:MAG: TIR domain-containing protein [Pseudomonadota bacterium]
MTDVFVSYSRKDRPQVSELVDAIEAAGFTVWWDKAISAGAEFDREIDTALGRARVVLVVWSESSVQSRWVREEADDGLERQILIPVTFDGTEPPRGFKLLQVLDLSRFHPDRPSSAMDELLSRIGEVAQRSPEPPQRKREKTIAPSGRPMTTRAKPKPQKSAKMKIAAAAILAVVLAAAAAGGYFWTAQPAPSPALESTLPTVVGIYPSNAFGPSQRQGLHAALESEAHELRLIDLEAPLGDMKTQKADKVLADLDQLLASGAVSAIVGPPITEFIGQVLDVVEDHPNPPAVFLTTAASRSAVDWDNRDLNIFRVGSGVNERAQDFADLARLVVASGLKMTFLVERVAGETHASYGEIFFNSIVAELPDWPNWVEAGIISRLDYDRGDIVTRLRTADTTVLFDQPRLVFVLGLGGDYKTLITEYFKAEDPPRSALLASWMTGYAIDKPFAEERYQYRQIVDLSDVGAVSISTNLAPDVHRFLELFGEIRPSMRDIALTYDTGRVIVHAVRAARNAEDINTISDLSEQVATVVRDRAFQGVFGTIAFEEDGQNRGGGRDPIYVMMYDPGNDVWRQVTDMGLLVGKLVSQ